MYGLKGGNIMRGFKIAAIILASIFISHVLMAQALDLRAPRYMWGVLKARTTKKLNALKKKVMDLSKKVVLTRKISHLFSKELKLIIRPDNKIENVELKLRELGFKRIPELKLKLEWARISDINGWGTEVNGEITRQAETKLLFAPKQLPVAFKLIKKFVRNWWTTSKNTTGLKTKFRYVSTRRRINDLERGFVVDFNLKVYIYEDDGTNKPYKKVFDFYDRSEYYYTH